MHWCSPRRWAPAGFVRPFQLCAKRARRSGIRTARWRAWVAARRPGHIGDVQTAIDRELDRWLVQLARLEGDFDRTVTAVGELLGEATPA